MKLSLNEVRTMLDGLRLGTQGLINAIEDSELPDDDLYSWGRVIGMLSCAAGTMDACLKARPLGYPAAVPAAKERPRGL